MSASVEDKYVPGGKSMHARMLAGEPYISDDPEIAADHLRAQGLCHQINHADPTDKEALRALFAELLGEYGEGAGIRPPFYCDYGYQTRVGAGTFINFGLVALDVAQIDIGDDANIGPNVQLLTPTHPLDPQPRLEKWEAAEPISIGNNVWLGGGVVVCPGVSIGDNTVVGAGSVVTKSLPPNVLAVGNPARILRSL